MQLKTSNPTLPRSHNSEWEHFCFSQMPLHNSLAPGFIPEVVIPKDRGGHGKSVPYYGQSDDRIPG